MSRTRSIAPARRAAGHKYSAKATACAAGHAHPSRKEARRCNELHLLRRAGEITDLEREPQFWFELNGIVLKHENGRRVGFKPDFSYRDRAGAKIAEDAKSPATRTEAYVLRATIFRALFPDWKLIET